MASKATMGCEDRILISINLCYVNNNNYTYCAKMAGKEETPKCRKVEKK
jgi:hypothetical protein